MCGLYRDDSRRRLVIREHQDILHLMREDDEMRFLLHLVVDKGVVLSEALRLTKRDFNLKIMRYRVTNRSGKVVYKFIDDYERAYINDKVGRIIKMSNDELDYIYTRISNTLQTRLYSLIELSDLVSD